MKKTIQGIEQEGKETLGSEISGAAVIKNLNEDSCSYI